jgi:diacylglycerol kinase family enzyme
MPDSTLYRIAFLINPISGGGQGTRIYDFLPEIMGSMGFEDAEWIMEYTVAENGDSQIENLLQKTQKLIAVGGDGTINAVMNCIVRQPQNQVVLGLIPLGTGNDLGRTLHLYGAYVNRGLVYLVRKLILAESIPFDLWMVNDQYAMAAYFSAGVDARIAQAFNEDRAAGKVHAHTAIGNKMHYGKCAKRHWYYQLAPDSIVKLRNKHGVWTEYKVGGYKSIVISNIPSFASGRNLFQNTKLNDKMLEIVFFPNRFRMIGGMLAASIGGIVADFFKKMYLPSYQATEVQLLVAPDASLQLDGETRTCEIKERPIHICYKTQVQLLQLPENMYRD